MEPFTLVEAAESLRTIADFVLGNDLNTAILSALGNTQMGAAQLALDIAQIAVHPEESTYLVIGHLQVAHSAYAAIHNPPSTILQKVTGQAKVQMRFSSIREAVDKDVCACCIMALCYVYLGERRAAEIVINLAGKAFENLDILYDSSVGPQNLIIRFPWVLYTYPMAVAGKLNPKAWIPRKELMPAYSFERFYNNLVSALEEADSKK